MSIYTKMQDIIQERGIGVRHMINEEGQCCLIGAKNLALGYSVEEIINIESGDNDDDYYFYSIEEITELHDAIVKSGFDRGSTGASRVYFYNDDVIAGDTEKALEILSKAEAIRRERKSK